MLAKHLLIVALVGAGGMALSGCSTLRSLGLVGPKREAPELAIRPVMAPAILEPAAAQPGEPTRTEMGRMALADGRVDDALRHFHQALALGEPAPPVLNGLGVGFAMKGRSDLARTYLQLAVQQAPSNRAYADNLRRFQASIAGPQPVLATLVAPAAARPRTAVAARGSLERVGAREFMIRSASGGTPAASTALARVVRPAASVAPRGDPATREPAREQASRRKVIDGFTPLVRISLADPATTKPDGQR